MEAPAGLLDGQGYPEPRAFIESQWHDSASQEADNMRHQHLGLAIPVGPIKGGLHWFHIRNVVFHFQGAVFGGIRKTPMRIAGTPRRWMPSYLPDADSDDMGRRKVPIPLGQDGHLMTFVTPLLMDLRNTATGGFWFEADTQLRRPDGLSAQARLRWRMWVDNSADGMRREFRPASRPTKAGQWFYVWTNPDGTKGEQADDGRVVTAEGWVSPNPESEGGISDFGYLSIEARGVRLVNTDPERPVTVLAQGRSTRSLDVRIFRNPDLHRHPPFYGSVLRDFQFTGDGSFTASDLPTEAVGDRTVFRVLDSRGDAEIGSGATLLVVKMAGT